MRLSLVFALPLLAACSPPEGFATDISREAARQTVRPILAERFPGVPLEPATDCVIDNAEASELFTLTKAAAIGVTPETTGTVTDILSRPETLQCLASDGLPVLLSALQE